MNHNAAIILDPLETDLPSVALRNRVRSKKTDSCHYGMSELARTKK